MRTRHRLIDVDTPLLRLVLPICPGGVVSHATCCGRGRVQNIAAPVARSVLYLQNTAVNSEVVLHHTWKVARLFIYLLPGITHGSIASWSQYVISLRSRDATAHKNVREIPLLLSLLITTTAVCVQQHRATDAAFLVCAYHCSACTSNSAVSPRVCLSHDGNSARHLGPSSSCFESLACRDTDLASMGNQSRIQEVVRI